MNNQPQNEKGLGLGLLIILSLVALVVSPLFFGFEAGPMKEGTATTLTGVYLQLWGVLFLLSYYFPHKTFFFRGLMWICKNFSIPKGREMAFFYFILAFSIGTIAVLKGTGII